MGLLQLPKLRQKAAPVVVEEKLNPSQMHIAGDYGRDNNSTTYSLKYHRAYDKLEVVRRGTDLLVDALSQINFDLKNKMFTGSSFSPMRANALEVLLNSRPNPYQDTNSFRRSFWMDFLLEGNVFLYFDGDYLYILPARDVTVVSSPITFIKEFTIGEETYTPDQVIHLKDNSATSLFRGDSRLKACQESINLLGSMLTFQTNFFNNGAVPGLVLKTDDILGDKLKARMLAFWTRNFNPREGGRKPALLDGGLSIDSIGSKDFKELDFSNSIKDAEVRILKALGVPPILLDSGNNANISPNIRLFYVTTVMPLIDRYVSAIESYFGYDVKPAYAEVAALRPELKDLSDYYTSLTNNGIMLGSEAREALRLPQLDDPLLDKIRIPANVAGSASGVSGQEGGAPPKGVREYPKLT